MRLGGAVKIITLVMSSTGMLTACEDDGNTSSPRFYPDMGDFYFGKNSASVDYAEFYISWTDPVYDDPDFTGEPIYEHDFNVYNTSVHEYCTSYTTLPDGHDDCPTAGVSDPDYMGFGFGSFNASTIAPLADYYGIIYLHRFDGVADGTRFDFNVVGSQMYHQFCSWDSIWCLGTAQSQILIHQWERDLYTGKRDHFTWEL